MPLEWAPTDISPHQTELATSLRIPFLVNSSLLWQYVTGFIVNPEADPTGPDLLDAGMVPDEDDVRLLAQYQDAYRERWYCEGHKIRMARFAPYDIDGSANFGFFKKREDGWVYRKKTWDRGPHWVGVVNGEPSALHTGAPTLEELIERAVGVRR